MRRWLGKAPNEIPEHRTNRTRRGGLAAANALTARLEPTQAAKENLLDGRFRTPGRIALLCGNLGVGSIRAASATILAVGFSGAAHAHGAAADGHGSVWSLLTPDPLVIGLLAAAGLLYLKGGPKAPARRTARGRARLENLFFSAAMLALALALLWPIDALADSLFAAHMAQHILLMAVAAPMLVLSGWSPRAFRALPDPWKRRAAIILRQRPVRNSWRFIKAPSTATVLQQIALWLFHAPAVIGASLHIGAVHAAMHFSLLVASFLFWSAILRPRLAGRGSALLGLLVTAKLSAILGALLAFAPTALYPAYGDRGAPWGYTPLEDQQLAGLVMMAPGAMMYIVAGILMAAMWLGDIERRNLPATKY